MPDAIERPAGFRARVRLAPDVVVTVEDPRLFGLLERDRKRSALDRLRALWTAHPVQTAHSTEDG